MKDSLIGVAGAALIVMAIAVLLFGRSAEAPDPESIEVPQLTLFEPLDGADVDGPLSLVFAPGARISPGPTGWEVGPLHLHALLNGQELMPGRTDIRMLDDGRYRWDLPRLEAGEYEIRIVWALDDHGSIERGAADPVTVRLQTDGSSEATPEQDHATH